MAAKSNSVQGASKKTGEKGREAKQELIDNVDGVLRCVSELEIHPTSNGASQGFNSTFARQSDSPESCQEHSSLIPAIRLAFALIFAIAIILTFALALALISVFIFGFVSVLFALRLSVSVSFPCFTTLESIPLFYSREFALVSLIGS
ncbi:hypothetical protein RHS03_06155, partial [Rhizoctonia solani]